MLLQITEDGECFLAKFRTDNTEGEIKKVSYLHVEPLGINPTTFRYINEVPEADESQVVFIIGQIPVDLKTSGLYKFKLSDSSLAIKNYEEDYNLSPGIILGYLDSEGNLQNRVSGSVNNEELSELLKALVQQAKDSIKVAEEKPDPNKPVEL
jgi:hypothetical protein